MMNKEKFIEELLKLNIEINDVQLEKLEKYCEILERENKSYNLTAITEKESVFLKHFYDSLTIVKIIDLNNESLCDLGTGAGFPGMVLKIIFPNLKVTLIHATLKKCNFLEKVIKELKLENIKVINARVEEYAKMEREKYDIVTARAVAPLKHLLEYGIPLLKVNGIFVAMKGNINEELNGIQNYENKLKIKQNKRIDFQLPIENSNRTLISFIKLEVTDNKYPRKYNEIKKKGL